MKIKIFIDFEEVDKARKNSKQKAYTKETNKISNNNKNSFSIDVNQAHIYTQAYSVHAHTR